MSHVSRRTFVGSLVATSALATNLPIAKSAPKRASSSGRELLRVQYTTGGHTVPLTSFTIFTDDTFADVDTTVFPHPNTFSNLTAHSCLPRPNVLFLYSSFTKTS